MTQTSPLITVITPAYNVGPYIEEAIESVRSQTYTDFEYLIVDDGSSDDTLEKVQQQAAQDDRIRVLRSDHEGGANARNLGIREARGKYIAFLDGDDRWHLKFLEKQLSLLQSLGRDVAAVFCRARVISEKGRVYLLRWQRSGKYDFDDMLIQSCPPRAGSSLLIKKEAFDAAGGFDRDVRSAQDLDMWLRIQRDSTMPYFAANPSYLLDIRVRQGAISRDHSQRLSALDELTSQYAVQMKHSPKGMAYVRAAVFAYRAGQEEYAERFTKLAKQAGYANLLRDGYGIRMLMWSRLSQSQRSSVRRLNSALRMRLGQALGVAGSLRR